MTASTANQWRLHFAEGEPLIVGFSPAADRVEVLTRYPGAIAAVEIASTVASCSLCVHASRYGNCGEPVRAGLSESHEIVKHPQAGAGCRAFESQ